MVISINMPETRCLCNISRNCCVSTEPTVPIYVSVIKTLSPASVSACHYSDHRATAAAAELRQALTS